MMSVRLQSFLIVALFFETMAQLSIRTPPQGGDNVSFPENQAVGFALYSMQADYPAGNTPHFTVLSSTCESTTPSPTQVPPFPISSTDQLVVPTGGLDAENCSHYTFTFRVSAGTSTKDSGPLTILVTDINDNPPTFNKSSYNGNVWKNDGQGQIVNDEYIIATDPDVSKLPVTLSISGAQTTFAIYQNGSVYVDGSPGLASLASPTVLTIQASDGVLTSTAPLSIIVHGSLFSSPYQNGGSCTSSKFKHSCSCLSGYTDDLCSSSPCQNGGACSSSRNNYTCDCLSGYVGVRCERVDYCHIKPCQNGNSCYNSDNTYSCNCTCPYANNRTDNMNCTKYDPHFPCLNDGVCKNGPVSHCLCVNNYTGDFCEIPPTITTTTITTTTITETRTTNTTTTTSQTTPLTTTPNGNVTKDKDTNNKNETNDWATIGSVITGVSASIIVFFAVAFACIKKNDTNPEITKPDAFELNSSQPKETYAT